MTVFVGDILNATAASVSANPTSSQTWQWLRNGAAIPSATATAYRITEDDITAALAVAQVETNFMGVGSATSTSTASVGAWSPSTLFALAEPGVWYDPSDLTTLFQDTAGTTPVTTPGQTVALALDKSKGLVTGPELVTNGDFSGGATGWTLTGGTATVTASGGALTVNASVTAYVAQSFATVIGRSYRYSVQIVSQNGAAFNGIRKGDGSTGGSNIVDLRLGLVNGVGVSTGVFIATATTTFILVQANSGAVITVDNISVRELPGFHATQSILASRPTYGIVPRTGRRNLLTFSEQFDNAAWAYGSPTSSVVGNAAASPIGTLTASQITFNGLGGNDYRYQGLSGTVPANSTLSVWLRVTSGTRLLGLRTWAGSFNSVTVSTTWQRFTFIIPVAESTAIGFENRSAFGGAGTAGTLLIWGAQLELGSTATAYQRVTTQFDVTEAGVPSLSYLSFDGIDDFLVTPTITPGIDKVQVFAGVRKLSDGYAAIVGFSTDVSANNGSFELASFSGSFSYLWDSKGTVAARAQTSGYAAPITNVLTAIGDISGDRATLRVNNTQAGQTTADQGTGNYLAYPLYIGRRGGTSLSFNGQIYSFLVRFGANLNTSNINRAEYFVSGKTGVTL